ncbi:MAG: tRNA (N(6)-L-threonylcarbamoyladenosine(37)-C(2))-methylthiotransferase MtaB [Lentisphaeraceae bacterium]|nr:tRNA (N(6)-L-threonylcarbamoyladenosine(37)-C(2))-methylthiotransferase MtaB [Lentisphaeraceae bacterium]
MAGKDLKATVHTLGCRLNQSESSIMEKSLEKQGYSMVPFKAESDLAIINTCTVTARADSDCRHVIRNYIKRNPSAFVAVVGCYSQMGYKVLADIEGVDLIMGNQDKLDVVNYVQQGKNDKPLVLRDRIVKDDFTIDYIGQSDSHTRANLKIQDGCDFMCTFCIIPMARGRARSRDLENLLTEARQLAEQGFKEIILTGVNIGTYDNSGATVLEVCDRLNEIDGIERIRISSIEPTTIPEELFDRMNDTTHKLVPYLHIPLQSGSDKVLKIMKRRYERQEYLDFIKLANERVKDLCIGTDVMVGMCGEDDDEFESTCDFLINSPVCYFHVFSYSERPGTASVKMDEKVDSKTIKRRSAVLRSISERKKLEFYEKFIDREVEVLFETGDEGHWTGYTDNYIRVSVASEENLQNELRKVKLNSIAADFVMGELV